MEQQQISAAFDSVNLIIKGESDQETIDRNKEHLRIMLSKDYFLEALTEEQLKAINDVL